MKLHRSLLLSTSALTFVATVGFATSAAACITVSSDTTISDSSVSCISWSSSNITVTSTGTITSNTPIATYGGNGGTLTNSGDIAGTYLGAIVNNGGGSIASINNLAGATLSSTSSNVIFNQSGSIGVITNSGLINGATGLGNNGTIGTIINNATGQISGGTGMYTGGLIQTIINSGTITGYGNGGLGIYSSGPGQTIGLIENLASGLITDPNNGIGNNGGTIGTIINNGTISSAGNGVSNNSSGLISQLTNSGTITGANAIANDATSRIDTITNNLGGTITGGVGITSSGSIGTIQNDGLISGTGYSQSAIVNSGTITSIFNGIHGTIVATNSSNAINNYSTISVISNSGTINGLAGIANSATIATIINNAGGLITGVSAFYNTGTIGLLSNAGTIIATGGQAIDLGIYGSISNSGLIAAPQAITGTILSALSNSGTIEGNINSAQALTITGGSIGGLGTLTGYNGAVGTIVTNTYDVTFDSNAYQLLDDDINVGASNTVFNNGLIRVNTTHNITGNYNQAAGATLVVGVTDPSHYGQLIVSGAATMTGSQVLIAPTSGSLVSGETFTIVQAATAGTNYSGVTATAAGFTATTSSITAGGFEDLIISLSTGASGGGNGGGGGNTNNSYLQTGSQSGSNGAAVGTVLDQIQTRIANGGNASFVPILAALNTIGQTQGSAAEGAAIKQLAPGQLSAGVAASNLTSMQSMQVVGQHQQNLRSSGSSSSGRAAGSEYQAGALWMQVSGGFANSTTAGAGFHQSTYGLTFGADDKISKNATLGLAVGWTHANAKGSNELSGDSINTSTPEIMGYGTYRMGHAYLDSMLGVGYNMFTQSRAIGFLNSVASSTYDGMQYMGNAEAGYDFAVTPRTIMTPLAGFQATRTDTNSYSESGAGAADTSVGHQIIDSYSTLLGGRITTALPTQWGSLLPEAKLSWVHDLNSSPVSSNASLGGVAFATTTPRISPDGAEVSLGATLERTDSLSLRAEYDGDLRSDYQSHTGLLKGEWKF